MHERLYQITYDEKFTLFKLKMALMKFYVQKLDSDDWPIQVLYSDDWLDANSYAYRNKLTDWLQEQNIEFTQTQHFKTFMFRFKREEDSTMFVMRWS